MANSRACLYSFALAVSYMALCQAETPPVASPKLEPAIDGITTDRPDFTEGTDTMRRGILQLEGGLLTASHSLQEGRTTTRGGPYPLFRLGISSRVELRLGSDGLQRESIGEELHQGVADVMAGLKVAIIHEHRFVPAVSVIAALSMPWGASYFSSGSVDPVVKLCLSKSLPGGFDVGGNANVRWDRAGGTVSREYAYSLTSGHALGRGFRGFAEVYRISPVLGDEAVHWMADAGTSHPVGHNAQVDAAVGHTMNARTPYWFVAAGFAIRTPLWH